MDRKKKAQDDSYIEPMPKKQFLELMREFKKSGGKYLANEESEAYLRARGAEANTINATTILFQKRPTRAAVYEELFHVKQFSEGKIDCTFRNAVECEIEAKEYLLQNAGKLQLTRNEIIQTRDSLAEYRKILEKLKGDE